MTRPADAVPPSVQAGFERLRQTFRQGVAQRWAVIAEAPDSQARQRALHNLKGAAGSFGFPELHDLAAQAEAALEQGQSEVLQQALIALEAHVRELAATV